MLLKKIFFFQYTIIFLPMSMSKKILLKKIWINFIQSYLTNLKFNDEYFLFISKLEQLWVTNISYVYSNLTFYLIFLSFRLGQTRPLHKTTTSQMQHCGHSFFFLFKIVPDGAICLIFLSVLCSSGFVIEKCRDTILTRRYLNLDRNALTSVTD